MFKPLIFLIFLFVFLHALAENTLCKLKNDLICTGHYNSFKYTKVCEIKSECKGKFDVKCSGKYCSTSKEICQKYFQRFNFFGLTQNVFIDRRSIERVEECPASFENSLRPMDVCKNCILNLPIGNTKEIFHKKCKCPLSHSFECGPKFCTKNNKVCNTLNHSNTKTISFEKCVNGEKKYDERAKYLKKNPKIF